MNNGSILVSDVLSLIKGDYPFVLILNEKKVAQGKHGEYAIRKVHWEFTDNISEIITKYGILKVDSIGVGETPPEFGKTLYLKIEMLDL